MANMWRVASYTNLEITLLSSRVRTYAGTNRAGCQNTPVTLCDSPNEGGGSDVRVTDSMGHASALKAVPRMFIPSQKSSVRGRSVSRIDTL